MPGDIIQQPPLHRHHPGEAHQLPMPSIRHTPLNEFNRTPSCPSPALQSSQGD
jgi:hypothetical protein